MDKKLYVTMPDGSVWAVPVSVIAKNRTAYYYFEHHRDEFATYEEAWAETVKVFEDDYEIHDWAENNMNWSDVTGIAVRVGSNEKAVDYQEGWVNGDKWIE